MMDSPQQYFICEFLSFVHFVHEPQPMYLISARSTLVGWATRAANHKVVYCMTFPGQSRIAHATGKVVQSQRSRLAGVWLRMRNDLGLAEDAQLYSRGQTSLMGFIPVLAVKSLA